MEQEGDVPLRLYYNAVRSAILRHWVLALLIVSACVLAAAVQSATATPLFRGQASLLIETRSGKIVSAEWSPTMTREDLEAQRSLALSIPVLERAHQLALNNPEVAGCKENIPDDFDRVARIEGKLLRLETVHALPKIAKVLADSWLDAYVQEINLKEVKTSKYAEKFLGEEVLPKLRAEWEAKTKELQAWQKEHNFFEKNVENPPSYKEGERYKASLTKANTRLASLNGEMRAWEDVQKQGDPKNPEALMSLKRARSDTRISELQKGIFDEEKKLRDLSDRYRPDSKEYLQEKLTLDEMKKQRDQLLLEIPGQIRADLVQAQEEANTLKTLVVASDKQLGELKANASESRRLEDAAEAVKKQLDGLEGRRNEADVAGRVQFSYAQPWERATLPELPFRPNRPRNLAMGVLLGLVLAGCAVYVSELLDDTVRSATHLEHRLGVNVIGTVYELEARFTRKPTYTLAHDHPKAGFVETLRALRHSLTVAYGRDKSGNGSSPVILVTSPGVGDGKTFLCSNLGILFATGDKKVLLIDADVHKATLSRAFELQEETGLLSLEKEPHTLAELVRPTRIPNLDLIPAGQHPGNPSAPYESPAFHKLIEDARQHYDVVLMDSPPMLAVSDAFALAAVSDLTLVSARSRVTRLAHVERVIEALQRAKTKEFAFVINGLNPMDAEATGYGYGYGYYKRGGYGYGYGSGYGYGAGYGYGGYGYGSGGDQETARESGGKKS